MMTYIVANLHFWSELLFYKTVTINRASIPVFFAASTSAASIPVCMVLTDGVVVSMTWIVSQRGYYLGL